jgi:hypothetical protein
LHSADAQLYFAADSPGYFHRSLFLNYGILQEAISAAAKLSSLNCIIIYELLLLLLLL